MLELIELALSFPSFLANLRVGFADLFADLVSLAGARHIGEPFLDACRVQLGGGNEQCCQSVSQLSQPILRLAS